MINIHTTSFMFIFRIAKTQALYMSNKKFDLRWSYVIHRSLKNSVDSHYYGKLGSVQAEKKEVS